MKNTNEMEIRFESRSANEGFARVAVASFLTQLNPTVEEVADVKTAVSEAVTNAIIHGYENEIHKVYIRCRIEDNVFTVEVCDQGRGIENVEEAMQPMYTTKPCARRPVWQCAARWARPRRRRATSPAAGRAAGGPPGTWRPPPRRTG